MTTNSYCEFESLAWLAEFERQAPVNEFQINGTLVWPVLRTFLIQSSRMRLIESNGPVDDVIELCRAKQEQIAFETDCRGGRTSDALTRNFLIAGSNHLIGGEYDVLFFSAHYRHALRFGAGFQTVAHAVFDATKHIGPAISVEKFVRDLTLYRRIPRNHPTVFVDWGLERRKIDQSEHLKTLLQREVGCQLAELRRLMATFGRSIDFEINTEDICDFIVGVVADGNFFKDMLQEIKPKILIAPAVLDFDSMGVFLAAKALNIPAVGVQEGSVVDDPMFVGWSARPSLHYDLLPDYLLAWDELSKDVFDDASRTKSLFPRVFATNLQVIPAFSEASSNESITGDSVNFEAAYLAAMKKSRRLVFVHLDNVVASLPVLRPALMELSDSTHFLFFASQTDVAMSQAAQELLLAEGVTNCDFFSAGSSEIRRAMVLSECIISDAPAYCGIAAEMKRPFALLVTQHNLEKSNFVSPTTTSVSSPREVIEFLSIDNPGGSYASHNGSVIRALDEILATIRSDWSQKKKFVEARGARIQAESLLTFA